MIFNIPQATEVLERTPSVLRSLLTGMSEEWLRSNDGGDSWSPYEIVGHLIHGEKTDWIPRARIILSEAEDKTFVPFDRFAQKNEDQQRTIEDLLDEFASLRNANLKELKAMQVTDDQLMAMGIHPELGKACLKELLSAWVVHDLGHISQIARVMASQYRDEVGVWRQYLGILK